MKPRRRRKFCAIVVSLCGLIALFCAALYITFWQSDDDSSPSLPDLETLEHEQIVAALPSSPLAHKQNCSLATCFDIYRCGQSKHGLSVYVHPLYRLVDTDGAYLTPSPSREFLEIRSAIIRSRFYEPNSQRACLILPGVDTLSVARFDGVTMAKALAFHSR